MVSEPALRLQVSRIQYSDDFTLYGPQQVSVEWLKGFYLYRREVLVPNLKALSKSEDSDALLDWLEVGLFLLDHIHRIIGSYLWLDDTEETRIEQQISEVKLLLTAMSLEDSWTLWAPPMRFALERLYDIWNSKHSVSKEVEEALKVFVQVGEAASENHDRLNFRTRTQKRTFEEAVLTYLATNPLSDYLDDEFPLTSFKARFDSNTNKIYSFPFQVPIEQSSSNGVSIE